jgi:GrpB-like predicted nucleotidyltransferase (UPF0157 family)
MGMDVFRFDAEISRPTMAPGSRFALGPLASADAHVDIAVVHLPAAGRIERQARSSPRLFAAMAGEGRVVGADGGRRKLAAGYAVLWAAGEEHEVHTDEGLTAVCIDGEIEVRALPVTREIVVVDYDPAWPGLFAALHRRIWPAIEDLAVRIDHVGSTAVPGLAAKPIIDLDIVVASDDRVRPVVERLAAIGYRWRGDLGIAGREAFDPHPGGSDPRHHLYLVVEDNRAHLDHWLLRDLLRADAEARDRYAALKRRNAEVAGNDVEVYLAAKAALVAELLTRARAARGLPPVTYWTPPPPRPDEP